MTVKFKKTKIKQILVLSITVLFSFLFISSINSKEIEAQAVLETFGVECIENFQENCPPESIPINQALREFSFSGLTSTRFEESLRETYGDSYNNICINENLDTIFRAYTSANDSIGDATLRYWDWDISITHSILQTELPVGEVGVPRACPDNWELQIAPNRLSPALSRSENVYGCCPSGLTFVNKTISGSENQDADRAQGGVCCRIPSNGTDLSWDEGDNECVYTDVNGTEQRVSGPNESTFTSAQEVLDNVDNIDYFRQLDSSQGENGRRPQLGRNLGPRYSFDAGSFDLPTANFLNNGTTEVRIVLRDVDGSDMYCPDLYENGCAVLSGGEVVDPDVLRTQSSLSCTKCFLPGEAIRLVENDTLLESCQENGETTTQELINNNIQDTIAYLKTDEANRPLLESCREQGGIYVAIGCIDPSPVGIITGLIRISFGVMGGVALIQLILAGLAYQSGQEEQIQEAQKRVIATIGGLAILVFSVLILRLIGVNVLDIVPEGAF